MLRVSCWGNAQMKHLVDLKDIGEQGIQELLHLTDRFAEYVNDLYLRSSFGGRTVAMVFSRIRPELECLSTSQPSDYQQTF